MLLFFSALLFKANCDGKYILFYKIIFKLKEILFTEKEEVKMAKQTKSIEISLSVKSIVQESTEEFDKDEAREKATTEIRKLMDDIWNRYPKAEVVRSNFDASNIVFEVK